MFVFVYKDRQPGGIKEELWQIDGKLYDIAPAAVPIPHPHAI